LGNILSYLYLDGLKIKAKKDDKNYNFMVKRHRAPDASDEISTDAD
jgi:hypothetical protein